MKKLFIIALSFFMFACSEETTKLDETPKFTTDNTNPVYLDENGITVKAKDWAQIGSKGTINSIVYTVEDEGTLREMIRNGVDVTNVCTSRITDMSSMFSDKYFFNGDIRAWDVSSVTNMRGMFFDADNFNGDISSWDVSSVTNMNGMLSNAFSFNQDLSSWDVSQVTDMERMFKDAISFNQDISAWDVGNVTYMRNMFNGAIVFNQNLGSWDVSKVEDYINFDFDTPQWTLPKPNFN